MFAKIKNKYINNVYITSVYEYDTIKKKNKCINESEQELIFNHSVHHHEPQRTNAFDNEYFKIYIFVIIFII